VKKATDDAMAADRIATHKKAVDTAIGKKAAKDVVTAEGAAVDKRVGEVL
jgi:hypothetical protein